LTAERSGNRLREGGEEKEREKEQERAREREKDKEECALYGCAFAGVAVFKGPVY
jgi:hypothetical protein